MATPAFSFWRTAGFACLLLLTLSACKSTRKGGVTAAVAARNTLAKTEAASLAFENLSLSGRANVEGGPNQLDLSVNYRINILEDSLMLIRLIQVIEGARILLTPDSIFMLNKLNRSYLAMDYAKVREFIGFDADFSLIQDLLLGNYHPIPSRLELESLRASPQVFKGREAGYEFAYRIDPVRSKVVGIESQNSLLNRHTQVAYDDFQPVANTVVPMEGLISVLAPGSLTFAFSHRKVELDAERASFAFRVPDSYEKMELD